VFQSAPLCGAKGSPPAAKRSGTRCFNPRPRAGRKAAVLLAMGHDQYVSIHAHVRGERAVDPHGVHDRDVSIHAHVRGESNGASLDATGKVVFQSTPTCGAKGFMLPGRLKLEGFNPRPRAGRKPIYAGHARQQAHVSIHAHVRGERTG